MDHGFISNRDNFDDIRVLICQSDGFFDFRSIVFIIPSYDQDEPSNSEDTDDGSDDDNGMRADSRSYDECDIEPYVSMEVFADAPGYNSLVQL